MYPHPNWTIVKPQAVNRVVNIVKTHISERTEGADTVPLFQIPFIEEGGRGMCRGSVDGGSIF